METGGLAVTALTTLALGIAALSAEHAPLVRPAQPGCTQANPSTTRWVQGQLDGEWEFNRQILGLSHLKNQLVRDLGGQAGDDEICNELFQRLHEDYQARLTAVDPQAVVYYYQVGDRYLVYVGTSDVRVSRWSIVFSFDLEYTELGSMI